VAAVCGDDVDVVGSAVPGIHRSCFLEVKERVRNERKEGERGEESTKAGR
jgi:hypothetical protein